MLESALATAEDIDHGLLLGCVHPWARSGRPT
jgi:hypothetical protein